MDSKKDDKLISEVLTNQKKRKNDMSETTKKPTCPTCKVEMKAI